MAPSGPRFLAQQLNLFHLISSICLMLYPLTPPGTEAVKFQVNDLEKVPFLHTVGGVILTEVDLVRPRQPASDRFGV